MKEIIKKKIYTWHRWIGIISIVPVLFWCISGMMHPFMAHWFKPQIAKEFKPATALDTTFVKLSLKQALEKNSIAQFKNVRMLTWNGSTYYQLKNMEGDWLYIDAKDGAILPEGDKRYAEYLARYFLQDSLSKVASITEQTDFSGSYKFINRLLPVWKVSFDRPDHMDVYVETPYSRLATFNPDSRKYFIWIFDQFHNWSFLESISNRYVRLVIMFVLLGIIMISALSGLVIYGFFWSKFSNKASSAVGKWRRYHRKIGLSVSLVTLTFAFSGAFHATKKWSPNLLPHMVYEPILNADALQVDPFRLDVPLERLTNVSVVQLKKKSYYQCFLKKTEELPASIEYYTTQDGIALSKGNLEYATYLAAKFEKRLQLENPEATDCCDPSLDEEQMNASPVIKQEVLTAFEKREYGFVFKRLPVVRIALDNAEHQNVYIETSTSRLAASIVDGDRAEGYSFAIFHKFLFLEWAGKNVRDIAMLISVLGVFTVSCMGLYLFIKR
ncbi:MAG: PepSY domain-containing protein [Cytophagaceae bacterium]|jgi:hypothetical protein|nr:PepSY domain-containing protein [Cytophagaceae bacterium]